MQESRTPRNRYPGVKPFNTEEREAFFGRERETEELFRLVYVKQVVVLYAKSGFGKSSLLNAGIIPKLLDDSAYHPLTIRFTNRSTQEADTGLHPIDTLKIRLQNELDVSLPSPVSQLTNDDNSLWHWLKTWQNLHSNKGLILLFDQFEELFTYSPEAVSTFSEELAEVLYSPIPLKYRRRLAELSKTKQLDAAFHDFLYQKPDLKIVFSIRTDRLALLNQLTDRHPAILQHCYELMPLRADQAEAALTQPAALPATDYDSPPFDYAPEAVQAILDSILKNGQVEATSVLQIVGWHTESKLVLAQGKTYITANDLGPVKDIIQNYYEDILQTLAPADRDKAQRLIEEKLISGQLRNPLSEAYIRQEFGISEALLKTLENSTLLRTERDAAGRLLYEISHDTLVEPIQQVAKLRLEVKRTELQRELEEKAKTEKIRADELVALNRKVLSREYLAWIVTGFALTLMLVSLYLGKKANDESNKSKALFWASESDKLSPAQGLRLLGEAFVLTNEAQALIFVKQQLEKIFNNSNNHRFKEKTRLVRASFTTFSPDSKWLVTSDGENEAKVWEIGSGKKPDFLTNEKGILYATFSPDSKWLVTRNIDLEAKVWEIGSGKKPNFLANEKGIRDATFSTDSKWLVTTNGDGEAKVWEIGSGKKHDFLANEKRIRYATFSPDSKWLVTTNSDDEAKVWEIGSGKNPNFLANEKRISDATFSPDSKWLVTRNIDLEAKVWEIGSGKKHDFLANEKGIRDATFSPDSKWLVTTNGDGEAKVWEIGSGKKHDFLANEKRIRYATFSPDSKWLVTTNSDDEAKVWEIGSGKNPNFLANEKRISDATFSPDSKWLVTRNIDLEAKVWEIGSGKKPSFLANEKGIRDATFSPDSKWLVTTNGDDEAKVWKIGSGKKHDFLTNEKGILYATFSPDSKWLMTTNSDDEAKVWEIGSGKNPNFLANEKRISDATFSPDSKWLVTKKYGGEAKVWEIGSGKKHDFLANEKRISSATFSPDSKWLVTTNSDDEAKVWEIGSGKTYDFLANEKGINDATFSPDSKLLITTSNHKIITYELTTGKAIQTLWVNKKPEQIDIIDNRYLFVVVGKAILKMDLQTQRGNFFSYGDGEPLDYTYEEIVEWMKVFGDEYLDPLSEEIKEKYGVK